MPDQVHLILARHELAQIAQALRGSGRSDLVNLSERLDQVLRQIPR